MIRKEEAIIDKPCQQKELVRQTLLFTPDVGTNKDRI